MTAAINTMDGLRIQVMASRHHQHPAGASTVALVVPTGEPQLMTCPARVLHLDAPAARLLARHLCDLARLVELTSNGPQTEREALMAAITPQELDAGVSDMVGLSSC